LRSGGGRLARTVVLGAVAVAFAIYWLAAELGLDREELLGYAAGSLLLVGVLVVLGMVLGALVWLARRAAERRRDPNSDSRS
jgi:high-affinity Fe2+/Pb2+ permease